MQVEIPIRTAGKVRAPFIGRRNEIAELRRLYQERQHVVILGPMGIGKTALVDHLGECLDLLVCADGERFTAICDSLEQRLGLSCDRSTLPRRKRRLLDSLAKAKRTVVFDHVHWTSPKLSSFLESTMERTPVWLCTRSQHSWDVGHFWPLLVRFKAITLPPLHREETRELIMAESEKGRIPKESLNIADWLHCRTGGNPQRLCEFMQQLSNRSYDLSNRHALRRLELDRRISQAFSPKQ